MLRQLNFDIINSDLSTTHQEDRDIITDVNLDGPGACDSAWPADDVFYFDWERVVGWLDHGVATVTNEGIHPTVECCIMALSYCRADGWKKININKCVFKQKNPYKPLKYKCYQPTNIIILLIISDNETKDAL